jgi:hypothetical protein
VLILMGKVATTSSLVVPAQTHSAAAKATDGGKSVTRFSGAAADLAEAAAKWVAPILVAP